MSRVELVNIVKKITQLSQRDKADLVRILEEALEGGGGDTSKFISVEPQDLTEEQKMQVRKNQGLYYKEDETVSSLIWDGVPSEDDIHIHNEEFGIDYYFHKISSVAIPPSKMLGAIVSWETGGHSATITQAVVDTYESQAAQGYYNDPSAGFTIVLNDSIEEPTIGLTLSRGVWFVSVIATGLSTFTKSIVLAEPYSEETIHHIEPKYIKDMYYEEIIEGEKTVFTPDDPNYEWQYPDNDFEFGTYGNASSYGWISEDTPTQDDIISIRFSDSEAYISGSELSSQEIEDAEGGTVILYQVNGSDSARKKFFVVTDDASLGGYELKKGIYVPNLLLFADPYIAEINYNGTTTIIHQVPQKYLPSGGLQTYDINMDWYDLDEIIRQGYGYGQNNFTEDDYNELCEALANGKMIALNIGRGAYGYPGGKLLTGNYLPLNAQDNDGYISEIIFPVIDWPRYNPNTGTITGNANYIISLKCGYGVESEEFKYEFVASVVNP